MVLRGVVHTSPVELLAEAVAAHMLRLNDGRMWIAAHWRRTDCKFIVLQPKRPHPNRFPYIFPSCKMAPGSGGVIRTRVA